MVSFTTTSYSDWTSTLTSSSATPTNALWKNETINIPAAALTSQFRVRFRITTDGSVFYYGWLIDNVKITAQTPGSADSYSWSDGTSVVGTTNPLTVNPTTNTSYTGTISYLGCTKPSNTVAVTVNPLPASPSTAPSTQCGTATPTAFAVGTADGNYRWYLTSTGGTALPGQVNSTLSSYPISAQQLSMWP